MKKIAKLFLLAAILLGAVMDIKTLLAPAPSNTVTVIYKSEEKTQKLDSCSEPQERRKSEKPSKEQSSKSDPGKSTDNMNVTPELTKEEKKPLPNKRKPKTNQDDKSKPKESPGIRKGFDDLSLSYNGKCLMSHSGALTPMNAEERERCDALISVLKQLPSGRPISIPNGLSSAQKHVVQQLNNIYRSSDPEEFDVLRHEVRHCRSLFQVKHVIDRFHKLR